MITKLLFALLLIAVATQTAADKQTRKLQLVCEDNEEPIFDDECISQALDERDAKFAVAEELFEEAVDAAEAEAREAIEKADAKLRRRTRARRIRRECEPARRFNRCAIAYIQAQKDRFDRAQARALANLEDAEDEAKRGRKATLKVARQVFDEEEEECGECVQFSFRF